MRTQRCLSGSFLRLPLDRICSSSSSRLSPLQSNQYHIYRDGAINYLEIRRCKDHGDTRVRVVAWNNNGQTETETFLRVNPAVDFRPGLKHVAPGVCCQEAR